MATRKPRTAVPLIYSCSGCSNIAQLTNRVAVELDRAGVAEMSCIAGVGGGVKSLVNKARSGRRIIGLDGCQLHCVKNSLANHDVVADWHFTLTDFDIKKIYHEDCSDEDFRKVRRAVVSAIAGKDIP